MLHEDRWVLIGTTYDIMSHHL